MHNSKINQKASLEQVFLYSKICFLFDRRQNGKRSNYSIIHCDSTLTPREMLKSRITAAKEKKVDLVLKITSVTDESPSKNGVDSCVPASEEMPQGGSLRQEEKEK